MCVCVFACSVAGRKGTFVAVSEVLGVVLLYCSCEPSKYRISTGKNIVSLNLCGMIAQSMFVFVTSVQ